MPTPPPAPADRRLLLNVALELTWAQALSVSREVRPGESGELRRADVAAWVRSLVREALREHTPPPGPRAPARRLQPRDLARSSVVQAFDRECRPTGALRGVCRIHLAESQPGHRAPLRTACGESIDGLSSSCELKLVDCTECLARERELGAAWARPGVDYLEVNP